jgi:hypothetical protein
MTLVQKLEKLEQELHDLKLKLASQTPPLKLEGIWQGIEITDEDIAEAKKSLLTPPESHN